MALASLASRGCSHSLAGVPCPVSRPAVASQVCLGFHHPDSDSTSVSHFHFREHFDDTGLPWLFQGGISPFGGQLIIDANSICDFHSHIS